MLRGAEDARMGDVIDWAWRVGAGVERLAPWFKGTHFGSKGTHYVIREYEYRWNKGGA